MAIEVRVSARILKFPQACCCCGRAPDTYIEATATRVTGKRVVRTQTKSWHFPACRNCQSHIRLYAEATEASASVRRVTAEGVQLKAVGLVLALCLIGLPIIAFGVIKLTVQVPAATAKASGIRHQAKSYQSRQCVCEGEAVRYREWDGSIHRIEFESDNYARDFKDINRSKLL